jgi:hypothetical protein
MTTIIVERDRHGRLVAKVFSPNGVDIGRRLVLAGWALAYRRYSTDYVDAEKPGPQGQAGDVAGNVRERLDVARIVTAAANAGTLKDSPDVRRQTGQWKEPADIGIRDALLLRKVGDRLRAAALDLAPPAVSADQGL